MSEITAIQWTEHTWNPWRGCDKVHERCKNCYMFSDQIRYGQDPTTVTRTKTWKAPHKWNREAAKAGVNKLVFTCSWSDWFHKDADAWREEAWAVVKACPNLTFQILTKRPERIKNCLPPDWGNGYPNVWIGSSLDPLDKNGLEILGVHARVKFLSLEPLIAPAKVGDYLPSFDWVIVGGESGNDCRPCNVDWIRTLVKQCNDAQTPIFVKQLGALAVTDNANMDDWPDDTEIIAQGEGFAAGRIKTKHKKGGDMNEWPEDLRVRQFPQSTT